MTAAVQTAEAPGETLGKPLPIKLSRIEEYPDNPRTWFDPIALGALATSIQTDGLQHPVEVCPKGKMGSGFILTDGARRYRAFHIIMERTGREPTVDAYVKMVDPREHFRKSMIANLHREDLIPVDTAAALHRLHTVDKESVAALAELTGKSVTYVENYLKLHTLPDEVKALMHPSRPKELQLSVTSAIDIARSVPEKAHELRITIAQEAIERSLGVIDTRTLIEHRTGHAGFRVGGFHRKPSDDYKVLASFLGRTRAQAIRLHGSLDIDDLYFHRTNETEERRFDAESIDIIISKLQALRRKIRKEK